MMSLNYGYSLLFISGQADCYLLVSVKISDLLLLSILIQRGNHAVEISMQPQSTLLNMAEPPKILWSSPWDFLPTSKTNSNSLKIFRETLKNSILNCLSLCYLDDPNLFSILLLPFSSVFLSCTVFRCPCKLS